MTVVFLAGLLPVYPGCSWHDYPLLSAKVHYDVSDVQMLANLIQTYTSKAGIDSEIRYVFPLPADASVCAFKAVIDDKRTIKGIVKEKAKAKAEYDQAVAQGKTAALLEQENVEIFQVSLGNIKPGQKIEVHISFVSVISHDGNLDSLRLTFPSTIAPRYGTPPSGMIASSGLRHSTDALDFSVAVEMTSHIKSITSPSHPISMKLGESTVEPSNDFDPKKARVSLSSPTFLEKDIVLVLSCQGLDRPRCMVESFSPEEGGQEYTDAYALTFVPRFEVPPLPAQEYIFLVDRSGSMDGRKMKAVRSALQILLRSLPSRGTSFNIISFGTGHTSLWRSSVTYSAESVKAASAHVDTMTADHGGTEIRDAIDAAFSSRVAGRDGETNSTSVFILTDGQAYDLDGVRSTIQDAVARAKEKSLLLRVFCMGIGDAVSKAMCDVISRAGKGTAAFVGENEKPDQKLMGLLRAARGAVVEDISIDWGVGEGDLSEATDSDFEMVSQADTAEPSKDQAPPTSLFDESSTTLAKEVDIGPQAISVKLPPPPRVQQAPLPSSLPPLYPGFRTSLFAIVRRGKDGKNTFSKAVNIKGTVLGHPVVLEVPVSQTSSTAEMPTQIKILHALAARALIQSIEDKATMYLSETDKAEVLRLAMRYGLASSQTSFIAIDEQSKSMETDPVQEEAKYLDMDMESEDLYTSRARSIPGSGMLGGDSRQSSTPAKKKFKMSSGVPFGSSLRSIKVGRKYEASPMADSSGPSIAPSPSERGGQFHGGRGGRGSFKSRSAEISHTPTSAPSSSSKTSLPSTTETFARAQSFDGSFAGSPALFQLLVQQPHAPSMPSALEISGALKETLWCTLLCVAYLETKFTDDKDVWSVLAEKAMNFVEDTLQSSGMQDVTEKMQELKEAAQKCIV